MKKNEMYPLLSKEIIEEKKKMKRFPQVLSLVAITIIILVSLSVLVENDRLLATLIIVIIAMACIVSNELPFGKIKEPTEEEITKLAKKKSLPFE